MQGGKCGSGSEGGTRRPGGPSAARRFALSVDILPCPAVLAPGAGSDLTPAEGCLRVGTRVRPVRLVVRVKPPLKLRLKPRICELVDLLFSKT